MAEHRLQSANRGSRVTAMQLLRRVAWVLVVIVDAGFIVWVAMAAVLSEYLLGSGSVSIQAAGYEGFTGSSWQDLAGTSPQIAAFMTVLFRVYGAYGAAVGLLAIAIAVTAFRHGERWAWWALLIGHTIAFGSAMTYDWTVIAIGPFELSEYLGLVLIYGALAATVPRFLPERANRSMA